MKKLRLYLIKFHKNRIIKNKTNLFDYIIGNKNY